MCRFYQLPEQADGVPVTANQFGQRDFEASGANASQNAKLIEFFRQPHNVGKFFKASFLEELSGSRRMNNRAVDLRKPIGEPVKPSASCWQNFCARTYRLLAVAEFCSALVSLPTRLSKPLAN